VYRILISLTHRSMRSSSLPKCFCSMTPILPCR
jgi:hypothetical protein